jgi:hypothetical protein
MKKQLPILIAVFAVAVIAAYVVMQRRSDPVPVPSSSPTASSVPGGSTYYNRYMSVDVPADWKLTEVPDASGAVNITSGAWVLFIHPAAVQASGVEGGRFDEYAGGAPGVELVMGDLERPRNGRECAVPSVKQGAAVIEGTSVARYDFFTVLKGAMPGCHVPAEAPPVWFLSIVGNKNGLNEVKSVTQKKVLPGPNGTPRQFAITMSYKAATVEDLPRQYSRELDMALREMDAIVSTIVFR